MITKDVEATKLNINKEGRKMNVIKRVQMCQLIEKMKEKPLLSDKLGLKDYSTIRKTEFQERRDENVIACSTFGSCNSIHHMVCSKTYY